MWYAFVYAGALFVDFDLEKLQQRAAALGLPASIITPLPLWSV